MLIKTDLGAKVRVYQCDQR